MDSQLRILHLKVSNRDAQILGERQRREELESQLQKAAENNRALARHNTRLLQQVDRLKTENELTAHELVTLRTVFKAREAECACEIQRLQGALRTSSLRVEELTAQLQEQERKVAAQPLRSRASCASGAWESGQQQPQHSPQQDSFFVCADSANSADSSQLSTAVGGTAENEPPCVQDSFLVCADSDASNSLRRWSVPLPAAGQASNSVESEDCTDCTDAFKEQRPPPLGPAPQENSFADGEGEGTPWASALPLSSHFQLVVVQEEEESIGQQPEQQVQLRQPPAAAAAAAPAAGISLPKTVRLFANKALISLPRNPLRPQLPARASRQAQQQQHQQPTLPTDRGDDDSSSEAAGGGSSAAVGGETESQGSNQPEGPPRLAASPAAVDDGDRWSATGLPLPASPQQSGRGGSGGREPAEEASVECAGGSFVAANLGVKVDEGMAPGSRSSARSRRRVSYALPDLRSKLRQGDSFTFGDPQALPKKSGARTKPRPKYSQPAPPRSVAIFGAVQEEGDS